MKPIFDENGLAIKPGDICCFYYDGVTGEYTGWSNEYIHEGVSMPGYSTDIDPGEGEDSRVSVFESGKWELIENHRGETVYSTTDVMPSIVDYIGPVKSGYTSYAPVTQHDKWDGEKWVTDTDAQHAADTASNAAKKSALIYEATQFIAPLVDAKDGGYIDESDILVLTAWQKYRYALTKVDPIKPVWPARPE